MASSINVKIAPLPRGNYSSSATYAKLDVVSYNGSSYMAIKAVPTGTIPTNTTYWQLLAEKPTIGDGTITTNMLADGAVTADKLDSSVSDKYAEVSGTYEDMVVGSAEQLLSTQYDTDSVPYAFRKSPYGDREFEEIVGGSIAWNQWVVNGNFADTSNWSKSGVTMTVSGNVATLTSSSNGDHYSQQAYQDSIPVGHKVIYSTDVKVDSMPSGESSVLALSFFYGYASYRDTYYATDTNWHTIAKVKNIEPTSGSNPRFVALRLESRKSTVTAQFRNAQLFDLTQMFGTSVADAIYAMEQSSSGSGVAFFRSLFPKPYYAYNAGQLISVSGLSAHKMTGKNQVPTTGWEQGQITAEGGINNARYAVSSPYILLDGGYSYMLSRNYPDYGNGQMAYHTYDINKTHLSDSGWVSNNALISPSEDCYIRITTRAKPNNQNPPGITPSDVGTMFTVQLEFGTTATTYEPYESHSYALDSDVTLRGIPKLDADNKLYYDGDVYASDGTVQRRYGIVDLGSLSWAVQNLASSTKGFRANVTGIKTVSASNVMSNMISALYPTYRGDDVYAHSNISNGISMWSTDASVAVYDSTKTSMSASDFKTAMSGVYLVYELATPTTESASPYVSPQICNEYGTEEYISAEQNGVTMIVGHNTKYPQNLRKKIEGLPWNFSNLIAPTEVTNKATRNYTVGSYLIMNNTLYKVTSAIANGGTITVGTNVTATTIMAEILAL